MTSLNRGDARLAGQKIRMPRRLMLAIALALGAIAAPLLVLPGPASATTVAVNFHGSRGGSCGGSVFVGQNLYNYPVTTVTTPADGYARCFATEAQIYWNNGRSVADVSGGASVAAYGNQGAAAIYGYVRGCPGVYNCSGWIGPIFPGVIMAPRT